MDYLSIGDKHDINAWQLALIDPAPLHVKGGTLVKKQDFVISHVFDASIEEVWRAWHNAQRNHYLGVKKKT
ncbi:SRPBCC domain-containing protein [Paenibacillus sepulcri]|uniref:Uncharacterized protein n=1 Tax=Paenibacillus sepulcri TaxID=359917 RepID=A0ABS7BUY2_9BACL|nr:hypothetical protein [Paenibacillus sepulcri]